MSRLFVRLQVALLAIIPCLDIHAQDGVVFQPNLKYLKTQAAYSQSAQVVATVQYRLPQIDFWDVRTNLRIKSISATAPILKIKADSKGKYFIAGTESGMVYIIMASTLAVIDSLDFVMHYDQGGYVQQHLPIAFLDSTTLLIAPQKWTKHRGEEKQIGDIVITSDGATERYLIKKSITTRKTDTLFNFKSNIDVYEIFPDQAREVARLIGNNHKIITIGLNKRDTSSISIQSLSLFPFTSYEILYSPSLGLLGVKSEQTLSVFNSRNGKLIKKYDSLFTIAEHSDKVWIGQSTRKTKFYQINLQSMELKILPVKTDEYYLGIAKVGLAEYSLVHSSGLRKLDYLTNKIISSPKAPLSTYAFSLSANGSFVYGGWHNIYEFSYLDMRVTRKICELPSYVYSSKLIASKNLLLVQTRDKKDSVFAIDYTTGKTIWAKEFLNLDDKIALSPDGNRVLFLTTKLFNAQFIELDLNNGEVTKYWSAGGAAYGVDYFDASSHLVSLFHDRTYHVKFYPPNPSDGPSEMLSFEYPTNRPIRIVEVSRRKDYMAVSHPEGTECYFIPLDSTKNLIRIDGNVADLAFGPADSLVAIGTFSTGWVAAFRFPSMQKLFEIKISSNHIYNLSFSDDGKSLFANTVENGISVINIGARKEVAKVILQRDHFVAIDPQGYYASNVKEIRTVGYRMGVRCYPITNLDFKFNRPDLLLSHLGQRDTSVLKAYNLAYLKRIKRQGLDYSSLEQITDFPESDIMNSSQIPATSRNGSIALHVRLDGKGQQLSSFNVWVNDVPLFGSANLTFRNVSRKDTTLVIQLSRGENKIEAGATNVRGIYGPRDRVITTYEPPVNTVKPMVYFIGIGSSKYQNPKYNLRFATKDIEDLGSAFNKRYPDSKQFLLIDDHNTRENIRHLKSTVLSKTRTDDIVIVSFSGHGLIDQKLNLYLATYDIDFTAPEKRGLLYEDLEWLLDSIPARNKLVLIDACHSGELDKDNVSRATDGPQSAVRTKYNLPKGGEVVLLNNSNLAAATSFELMQQLFANISRGNGATVVSAASGTALAFEGNDWNNGVFTYSVLDGLVTKKADANHDGSISVNELKDYVTLRVESLTAGRQKPTSRQENLEYDWKIW